jgi:hypothetical protein
MASTNKSAAATACASSKDETKDTVNHESVVTLWLPEYFWTDSEECEAVERIEFLQYKKGRGVQVRGPRDAFFMYRNRAEHYVHPWGPDGTGLQGLKASARATLKKLEAAGL